MKENLQMSKSGIDMAKVASGAAAFVLSVTLNVSPVESAELLNKDNSITTSTIDVLTKGSIEASVEINESLTDADRKRILSCVAGGEWISKYFLDSRIKKTDNGTLVVYPSKESMNDDVWLLDKINSLFDDSNEYVVYLDNKNTAYALKEKGLLYNGYKYINNESNIFRVIKNDGTVFEDCFSSKRLGVDYCVLPNIARLSFDIVKNSLVVFDGYRAKYIYEGHNFQQLNNSYMYGTELQRLAKSKEMALERSFFDEDVEYFPYKGLWIIKGGKCGVSEKLFLQVKKQIDEFDAWGDWDSMVRESGLMFISAVKNNNLDIYKKNQVSAVYDLQTLCLNEEWMANSQWRKMIFYMETYAMSAAYLGTGYRGNEGSLLLSSANQEPQIAKFDATINYFKNKYSQLLITERHFHFIESGCQNMCTLYKTNKERRYGPSFYLYENR